MNREDRAKQFLPFDALVGLRQELLKREQKHERISKIQLSEESMEEISAVLVQIEKGTRIDLTYFRNGMYISVTDDVIEINKTMKYLMIGIEKVFFDQIYKVSISEC